tara:strand:+ start:1228 stop:2049 length:822 start_codon:yes stop_codon:yes gene_type:complete
MIFDCFSYFNEDLILDLRLNTLDPFVDKFVILEATKDHAGRNRKLNFNIEKFKKFKNKIRYIVIKDLPDKVFPFKENKSRWHENHIRDRYQRDQIMRGLFDAKDDDLILISDLDEIPDLSKLESIKIKKYAIFFQKIYKYKINLLSESEYPWQGTRIIRKKFLKSPQWLRNKIYKRIKFWQLHRHFTNPKFIDNGGWHFSYIMSLEKIKHKIESFAHGEWNLDKFKNIDHIKKQIEEKRDLYNSNRILKKVEIDQSFPRYIRDNISKFREFIV